MKQINERALQKIEGRRDLEARFAVLTPEERAAYDKAVKSEHLENRLFIGFFAFMLILSSVPSAMLFLG